MKTFIESLMVDLPIESFGDCLNHRNCRNYDVVLGDGLCVRCWDVDWKPPGSRKPRSKKTGNKKTVSKKTVSKKTVSKKTGLSKGGSQHE